MLEGLSDTPDEARVLVTIGETVPSRWLPVVPPRAIGRRLG